MPKITGSRGAWSAKRLLLAGVCTAASIFAVADAAWATPTYSFQQALAVPGVANFSGYDAATFDPSTQLYYLTDRSNNGIDVYSGQTNSFVSRIGAGDFAGSQGGNNDISGPNGIAVSNTSTGGKVLIAGNGGGLTGPTVGVGNVLSFNLNPAGTAAVGNPTTTSTAVTGLTPSPSNRVDGVTYAPTTNTILAANNASNPGYISIIDNSTGTLTHTIILDGTNGTPNVGAQGVEGTVFDAAINRFVVALPSLNANDANDPGGVIIVNPTTGAIEQVFSLSALGFSGPCSPTGLAQGAGSTFLVACSDPNAQGSALLDISGNGSLRVVNGITGSDQAAYDPTLNTFYESDRDALNGPVLGIIDGTTLATQFLPIGANDHSVAVDPANGEVFLASGSTTAFPGCTNGCVAVFTPVPEPGSLPVLIAAVLSLGAVVRFRRS